MKLSIITINYNNKVGLQKTIDSVTSQTFKTFEWIIIDGGSTDGSKELIEKYTQHITYWVSEPDKGIYNAMNKGIKVAKGEYLLFLNSGDYFNEDNIIERVIYTEFVADVVYGSSVMVWNKDYRTIWDMPIENVTGKLFFEGSLLHQASFIRRNLFDKFGNYDETYMIAADWKFFTKAIVFGNSTVQRLPFTTAVYGVDGISTRRKDIDSEERKRGIGELWPPLIYKDYERLVTLDKISNNELVILALKVYNTNRYIRSIARYTMTALIAVYSLFKKKH